MAVQLKVHNPYAPVFGPQAMFPDFAQHFAAVPLEDVAKDLTPEDPHNRPNPTDPRFAQIFLGQVFHALGPAGIRRLFGAATGGAPIYFVDVHYQNGRPKGTATLHVLRRDVHLFLAANRQIRVLANVAIVALPGAPRNAIDEMQDVFARGGFNHLCGATPLPRHLMTVELYRSKARVSPPPPLTQLLPHVLPLDFGAPAPGDATPNGVSSASASLVHSPGLPAVAPAPPAPLLPMMLQPCRTCPSCARSLTF